MDSLALRPAPPVRSRRPRVSLWLLRVVLTAQLVTAVTLPVLAGLFLGGDVDAVVWHGIAGGLLVLLGVTTAVVAGAYVLGGRGRWWVLPVAVLAAAAEVVQLTFGYAGTLSVHVPLGVGVVTAVVVLTGWAWSPAARRPR
ncbi:hypothetical protein [Modestobacter versicolor]|uniref:hypothetical protein n=1 Tax=Modestobacter versicolor TaxID=429133 RepID=UPI0034DE3E04